MKYKVGDTVRVRKDLEVGNKYGEITLFDDMKTNEIMKIIKTTTDEDIILENFFHYNCEMLEPVEEATEEIIEEDKNIRNLKKYYDGEIEEYCFYEDGKSNNNCIVGDAGTELLIDKINELIDEVNKLKED